MRFSLVLLLVTLASCSPSPQAKSPTPAQNHLALPLQERAVLEAVFRQTDACRDGDSRSCDQEKERSRTLYTALVGQKVEWRCRVSVSLPVTPETSSAGDIYFCEEPGLTVTVDHKLVHPASDYAGTNPLDNDKFVKQIGTINKQVIADNPIYEGKVYPGDLISIKGTVLRIDDGGSAVIGHHCWVSWKRFWFHERESPDCGDRRVRPGSRAP
jgi:hypothetical protein